MSQQTQAHCESEVKALIRKWETDVHKQLRATRLDILTCRPFERAYYKGKIKSLSEVLELLHGKNTFKMTKRDLKNERSHFQMELQMAKADYHQMVAKYEAQKRSNKYLKIQLCQQFQLTNKLRKENEMLHYQIKKMRDLKSNRLEESPAVTDLTEEAAHKVFEAMLMDQRQTITHLKDKLRNAERTLQVQHQEDKDFVLKREHEWAEKVKSLEKRIQCLHGENSRWPNLFCQLLGGSYKWLSGSQGK